MTKKRHSRSYLNNKDLKVAGPGFSTMPFPGSEMSFSERRLRWYTDDELNTRLLKLEHYLSKTTTPLLRNKLKHEIRVIKMLLS